MSQYRRDYQQPPPQGQQQQSYDEYYNQYPQQQGQDGRRYGAQYTGQPTYDQSQGGGPVQPHRSYQEGYSPRTGQYGQSYQPAPQQNDPHNYVPQTYDPRAYASPALQQQSYSPAGYGSPAIGTGGSGQSYTNSPNHWSSGGFSPQHQHPQQSFTQPPRPAYSGQMSPTHPYAYSGDQSAQPYGSYNSPNASPAVPQNAPYPISDPPRVSSAQYPGQRQYVASPSMPASTEAWRPSPPYQAGVTHSSPSLNPSNFRSSLPSPPSTTPGPTPPAHAPSRSDTFNRHPQARPLPGPPASNPQMDYFPPQSQISRETAEENAQNDLFDQVEAAVRNAGTHGSAPPYPTDEQSFRNGSNLNGRLSPGNRDQQQYSSDSDLEATRGLAMLQQAEHDEDNWRQSNQNYAQFGTSGSQRIPPSQSSARDNGETEEDYSNAAMDMSSFGGGYYDVHMPYGGDPSQLARGAGVNGSQHYSQPASSQHSSMRRSHTSQSSQLSRASGYDYRAEAYQGYSHFNTEARVDAGGTGGLQEPSADGRRHSFDEGDEYSFSEGPMQERYPDEPLDIFYQPASTTYRPLPPPPESLSQADSGATDFSNLPSQAGYPAGPADYEGSVYHQGQWVPRSTSLVSHTTTPQVQQPLRSKTDADPTRARSQARPFENSTAIATPGLPLDLPTLPGKRFMPAQLGAPAFSKCAEPWSLMSLLKWLITITSPEQVTEIKEAEVKEALVALFTNKVPTMNITDAEGLSSKVVQDMYDAGTLVKTEEWVKIVPGIMEGVIFQLTGSGCYSHTLHDHVMPGRCYSHHCQRTLKKLNLQAQPTRAAESWAEFYNLKKEDIDGKDKKDLERQNILYEIVLTEDIYMEQLNVLRILYRDPLAKTSPSIIAPKRKDKFLNDVFGKLDAIKQANMEHLLPQLKYRQQEQGPWVVGFSDIFRQWIRKAKAAYIDYAGGFPGATFMVRQEIDRNMDFRSFIDRARSDPRGGRLGWDTYLKSPITRLQRYTLLLQAVLKTIKIESEEKANLKIAYDEVKAVTLECDARVAEMQRKVDLSDLALKLVLRPGMHSAVELNLDHFGRELIHRGDLQRMGGTRFTWLDCHALLFDHYLVLAKTVIQRTDQNGKVEKYDVSRLPIPMDLLILESTNDSPVQKSKGLNTVRDVTGRTSTPVDAATLVRTPTAQQGGPSSLQHTNTSSSGLSLQTVTTISDTGRDADKIMYPFKVKHLGRETYTLFAPSESARRDWCTKIIEAKTKHAVSLHKQKAEPFKLRVMADSSFVFDAFAGTGGKGVVIQGTPVDRAIKEVEERFKDVGRPGAVCRARVNCATSFTTLDGIKNMVAVGTDFGVYLSDIENPRGWTKCISMSRVTQVAVLEEFNLFLLISDKSLIAYHLDVVCPSEANGLRQSNDSARKAPQKLSGSKDVGFFVTGKMKDRALVFYKKRENLASVFKVLEPIYQRSTERKRTVFRRGATEFFREYDEFYIPAECSGINLFHSSLAVSTARGFEVLTLDKKQPWSVPDLSAQHVKNIAEHIKEQKALGMLRLSDQEFLLVYANCAVYVNKHGDVSRSVIMEFVGTAQSAALYDAYLILFDTDFVEIRNAQNGRLKQIIAGNEIKCLDDGGSWSSVGSSQQGVGGQQQNAAYGLSHRTVKFVMQHPEMEKTQIVVELVLNEKRKD